MKVANLSGAALDWAVAKCEGWNRLRPNPHKFNQALIMSDDRGDSQFLSELNYSTNWSQGGPIIEREMRAGMHLSNNCAFYADADEFGDIDLHKVNGSTPLIAAMRCYVASKLGDEIEIPEELL